MRGFFTALPIYVTRANADGETATYSFSAGWTLIALGLTVANVIVWGVIGLVVAARVVLG